MEKEDMFDYIMRFIKSYGLPSALLLVVLALSFIEHDKEEERYSDLLNNCFVQIDHLVKLHRGCTNESHRSEENRRSINKSRLNIFEHHKVRQP